MRRRRNTINSNRLLLTRSFFKYNLVKNKNYIYKPKGGSDRVRSLGAREKIDLKNS